jgi:hypothetical protein
MGKKDITRLPRKGMEIAQCLVRQAERVLRSISEEKGAFPSKCKQLMKMAYLCM